MLTLFRRKAKKKEKEIPIMVIFFFFFALLKNLYCILLFISDSLLPQHHKLSKSAISVGHLTR